MPTFVWLARFGADFKSLTPAQQDAFLAAVEQFVEDLSKGGQFVRALRVKVVRAAPGIFEMTWADDGRATIQYGAFVSPGEPHVIWRRIGTHQIFKQP